MNDNTVYIIGAGASQEVNLPTGYELKRMIAELLDMDFDYDKQTRGDRLIVMALREYVKQSDDRRGDINPYLEEAQHIKDAMPQAISIDNFIDTQKGKDALALCGKLSIIRAILKSEKDSLLYFKKDHVDSTIQFGALENTWYLPFFQLITENCGKDDLEGRLKSISLIVFNYDRCIEHFLLYAFKNYYRVSEQEASKLVSYINIYHPYGKVGHLPWQDPNNATEYGETPKALKLLKLVESIKTFTEGTNPDSSDIVQIKEEINNAERLVFLGFAFHKLNMEFLKPKNVSQLDKTHRKVFATALGMSLSDKNIVISQINGLFKNAVYSELSNLTCKKLFSEFWRSLSF